MNINIVNMKIYQKLLLVFVFLYLSNPIAAQTDAEKIKKVENDFNFLLYFKREYERYDAALEYPNIPQTRRDSLQVKKDSWYNKYVQKAKSIRENADFYLPVINEAIKNGRVESDQPERVLYNHVNTLLPFDGELNSVSRLELHKLVKQYIIEADTLLPAKTEAYRKVGHDVGSYKLIR
ncbi:hypothetical protein C5749_06065 [Sphingobacterium gobiense]|uniref:DUF885 domain-containing protein n=2 Tax=Sphingobacterium gobiense TaxID=1382456 RepID=A0A2S9JU51_9SPHI|nr:hypothetical protein C5749_06065 [Sphingobacterium gobiense]